MSLSVDITKELGSFTLNVRFQTSGGVLSLLGASGCGKSMTLKCIAGIEAPDEGKIVLNGETLFDSERGINLPPQKRKTGYLFQNSALFPNMTAAQNILCGLHHIKSKEVRRYRLKKLVETFRIEGLEDHYPAQLSGGQQQRVALARILASEPRLILLDEPFSALDSYLRWQIEQEISAMLSSFQGMVIFVSHDRDEVFRLSDSVAVMSEGRVDSFGSKHEMFRSPKTYVSCLLTGCKNISRAEKISPGMVYASDWGLAFRAGEKCGDDVEFVGLRAHYLEPCDSLNAPNAFAYEVEQELEDTFTYIRMIRKKDALGAGTIRWEISREEYAGLADRPNYVCIPAEKVLLLGR